jgi:hypothetical protein
MIEAKRSKLILTVNLAKRNECIYSQKSNLRSEANWLILKFYNIEAKRTDSLVILYLKQQQKSELSFFYKTKDKKRKGSIVNYRSFAITKAHKTVYVYGTLFNVFTRYQFQSSVTSPSL